MGEEIEHYQEVIMKTTVINGRPRSNGSTAFIINKILEGMNISNADINYFCLGQTDIKYCLGCKDCYKTGKCVQHDDVEKNYEKHS